MENSDASDTSNEADNKVLPLKMLNPVTSGDYLKGWPVSFEIPVKNPMVIGARQFKTRSYRYKRAYMNNWLIPLDGPMSMDHVHFLLECFVVSAGPVPLQLGRYHPQSDPEEFAQQNIKPPADIWSINSDDDDYWPKLGQPLIKVANDADHAGTSSEEWPVDDVNEYTFENYFPRPEMDPNTPRATSYSVTDITPDDAIVRELSEMRLVLERLLDNHGGTEWEHPHGLRDVLDLLPEDISPQDESPHYPKGDWEFYECGICFETQWLYRRPCCRFAACFNCLESYYSAKVDAGQVKIFCCNTECDVYVHREEILARLKAPDKSRYQKLLILANQDASTKTCPRCSQLITMPMKPKKKKGYAYPNITCPSCELDWCFNCQAPLHGSLSCKQFRKGDRLLKSWAKEQNHGQLNAQKCPRCKIYIQRTTGCDHMHCTRCKTDFCYKCGERFRYLKFFGDHYSKLSIFGCKYRFKADQPVQRKVIRGALFGGKIIAAPLLGALALCAGAVAVGISIFALPVYGGVRLYRHCEGRKPKQVLRRQPPSYIPNVSLHISHSFP